VLFLLILLRFYFRLNVWAVQNRCICCFTQELFAVRFTADREQGWGLLSCQMLSRVWIVSFFECCTLDAVDFWQLQTVRQSSPHWRLQPSLTSRQQMGTTKLNTRPGSRWQRWWDISSTAIVPHDPYNAIQTSLTGHSFFSILCSLLILLWCDCEFCKLWGHNLTSLRGAVTLMHLLNEWYEWPEWYPYHPWCHEVKDEAWWMQNEDVLFSRVASNGQEWSAEVAEMKYYSDRKACSFWHA